MYSSKTYAITLQKMLAVSHGQSSPAANIHQGDPGYQTI